MRLKVLVFFVRYGIAQYASSFRRLQSHLESVRIEPEKIILIDNQNSPGGELPGVEAGDNRFYEFSGWNSVLKRHPELVAASDVVLFVTSAFEESFNAYLSEFSQDLLKVAVRKGVCVGHLDAYPQEVSIFGQRSQAWMRTSFFALPTSLVLEMGVLTAERSFDFFSEDFRRPFRDSADLSENYRAFILDWLTGPGLGHGPWHSRFDLTEESFPRFKQKSVAIFNEHFLSISARQRGYPTIDPCWLNQQLQIKSMEEIDFSTDPMDQIEIRNRVYFGDLRPTRLQRIQKKLRNLF
jgi:hypothetical protein